VSDAQPPTDAATPAPATPTTKDRPRGGRRRRWTRRLLFTAVFLGVVYTLGGFFGVPALVKHIVAPRISEQLNGTLTIDTVRCNPFTLGIVLEDVLVTDESGASLAEVGRFEGNIGLISTVFKPGLWIRHARVFDPSVEIAIDEQGVINLASIVRPSPEPAPTPDPGQPLREIPRIVVEDLQVTGARTRFQDLRLDPPLDRTVSNLDFVIDRLDTAPGHRNEHTLTARIGDATSLDWRGFIFLDPLTAEGTLTVDGLELAPFAPYLQPFLDLELEDGRLALDASYVIAPVRVGQRLTLDLRSATLSDLRTTRDGQPLAAAQSVSVTGLRGDVDTQTVSVASVELRGADATIRRNADGGLELAQLMIPREAAADGDGDGDTPNPTPATTAPRTDLDAIEFPVERLLTGIRYLTEDLLADWTVDLESVTVVETALAVRDAAVQPPVAMDVTGIDLAAGPISSRDGFRTPFRLGAAGPDGASVALSGVADPGTAAIEVDVALENIVAARFAPYLPAELPAPLDGAELASATISVVGTLDAGPGDDGQRATWDGQLLVTGAALVRAGTEPPVSFDRFALTGRFDASVPAGGETGPMRGDWAGRLELASLAAAVDPGDGPATASVGDLTSEGRLAIVLGDGPLQLDWSGDLAVTDVRARVTGPAPAGVELDTVRLAGGVLDWADDRGTFVAESLDLDGPQLDAVLAAIDDASASPAPGTAPAPAGAPGAAPLTVRLGRLTIAGGGFAVEDRRRDPPLMLAGSDVEFTAERIDTAGGTPMTIDLASRLSDVGSVSVRGDVDPFRASPFVDVSVAVADLPLRPFSSSVGPSLGYAIDSGRLSLTLPVRVEEGRLDGRLDATLAAFHLGGRVPSRTAPDLPLKLGLDLMRDADDGIRAGFRLSGDVTDPNFSLGEIIQKAAFNFVGNVVTAPFKIIGNLVGAGDDVDLSRVACLPGAADPAPGEASTLDLLANAMRQRPALLLTITGVVGPQDEAALRDAALTELVRARTRATAGLPVTPGDAADPAVRVMRSLLAERRPDLVRPLVPVPPGRLDQVRWTAEDLRQRLRATIELAPDALDALALARAEQVAAVLSTAGGVPAERLRVVPPAEARAAAAAATGSKPPATPRPGVRFDLKPGG
jgi:hypothetical protein